MVERMLRCAVPGNFVQGVWPAAARTAREFFSFKYNYIKPFDGNLYWENHPALFCLPNHNQFDRGIQQPVSAT